MIAVNALHPDLFFPFQMISKYCDIKKETIVEFPGESPLTSFTQLQSLGHEAASSPEEGSAETTVKWIVPEDLPIDLRAKIAVCLIHVRQLHSVKVTMEKFLQFGFHIKAPGGPHYAGEFENGALFLRWTLGLPSTLC